MRLITHRTIAYTIAVLALAGTDLVAAPCLTPEVKPEDPFQFTMALVESFSYAKSALSIKKSAVTLEQHRRENLEALFEMIYGTKSAERDYICAAELLEGYLKSRSEMIATSASGVALTYRALIKADKEILSLIKATLDDGAGNIKAGALAEKIADLRLMINETWKTLLVATVAATHALVKEPATDQEKLSSLRLTAQQRETIAQKLEKEFGLALKGGVKAGQSSLLGSAALLYAFVSDPQWKSSDSK